MYRFLLSALFAVAVLLIGAVTAAQEDAPAEPALAEDAIDYKALENPVPYTAESIKRGRTSYMRYCTECHGPDGKAQIDIIADATDLTTPKFWKHGVTPGEVYRSIRKGAGVAMPPFAMQMRREEDTWHVVNFVQSLWPADLRPELQEVAEEPETEAETGTPADEEGGTTP